MSSSSLSQTAKAAAAQGSEALRVLAQDIRALRKARGLTLSGLAEKLGRSVGRLSQAERGIARPSFGDLKALANYFSVPVSLFVDQTPDDGAESRVIGRAGRRRSLPVDEAGAVEELLSPDLGGSFQILRSEFPPGGAVEKPFVRATEEAGYVISGVFEIEVAGLRHRLNAGDSFRFRKEPFRWRNPGQ